MLLALALSSLSLAPPPPPTLSPGEASFSSATESRPEHFDPDLYDKYHSKAITYGVGVGLSVAVTAAMRVGYAEKVSRVRCEDGLFGDPVCSKGPQFGEPLLLATSWMPMTAGMAFSGLVGRNLGLRDGLHDGGPRPKRFVAAGAITLTAGLGYFFISRFSLLATVWDEDQRMLTARETTFATSASLAYVGAGLLGYGRGIMTSHKHRRALSIAPVIGRDSAMVMLTLSPPRP